MSYEKLEINLLAANGKVERRIRAFAGRVTVLRGATDADLVSYTRALNGQQSTDRFSIMIDSTAYRPAEHTLVGFGERFPADGSTVGHSLIESGYQNDGLAAILLASGLGGAEDRRCSELNEIEARILRLLLGCAPRSASGNGRVLVLNDPFRDLDSTWVESLAERLAEFAWKQRAIVLVVNLSNRPEAWIDNELIARIQVGGNRRRTIGFGSASPEMGALLEQLRNENAPTTAAIESANRPTATVKSPNLLVGPSMAGLSAKSGAILRRAVSASTNTPHIQSKIIFGVVSAGFVAVVALLLFSDLGFESREPTVEVATNIPAFTPPTAVPTLPSVVSQPVNVEEPQPLIIPVNAVPTKAALPIRIKPGSVLSAYPEKIAVAIIRAYDETDSGDTRELTALRTDGAVTKLVARNTTGKFGGHDTTHIAPASIFGELRDGDSSTTTSSTNASTSSGMNAEMVEEDLQRRREEIRQRFLEAIERSAGSN